MSELVGEFPEICLEVGECMRGTAADGTPIVAQVHAVRWWVKPLVWLGRSSGAKGLVVWAIARGVSVQRVWEGESR